MYKRVGATVATNRQWEDHRLATIELTTTSLDSLRALLSRGDVLNAMREDGVKDATIETIRSWPL